MQRFLVRFPIRNSTLVVVFFGTFCTVGYFSVVFSRQQQRFLVHCPIRICTLVVFFNTFCNCTYRVSIVLLFFPINSNDFWFIVPFSFAFWSFFLALFGLFCVFFLCCFFFLLSFLVLHFVCILSAMALIFGFFPYELSERWQRFFPKGAQVPEYEFSLHCAVFAVIINFRLYYWLICLTYY